MSWETRIPEYASGLDRRVNNAARTGADLVKTRAQARVPIDTGLLKSRIHVEDRGEGDYAVVAGDHEAFYGHIVEHGGAHRGPRPFLVPALEESTTEIVAFVEQALE